MRRYRPPPPASITKELFLQFRSPRRGTGNPEIITNPVWAWLMERTHSTPAVNSAFDGLVSEDTGPCWSFARYGQTETLMPDGRLIRIAGEHEDWYDPNFHIYNDVCVTDAAGNTQIFGYSEEAFPPTDFHTATLVGDRIVIIGNLSYPQLRQHNAQVMVLDTDQYNWQRINASDAAPGWLHKHTAELVDDGRAILIRGGQLINPRWPALVDNIDDWQIDLREFRWDRLTNRAWPRFMFVRQDRENNRLWWLRRLQRSPERESETQEKILGDLAIAPRLDLLETLYRPDIPYSMTDMEDQSGIHRIAIDDVIVRYSEDYRAITLVVEGFLPETIIERLRLDLLEKLSLIQKAEIECMPVLID